MSRERLLVMEVEAMGETYTSKAVLKLTPPPSAKPIVNFRRHSKWKDYIDGTIDGTTPTSIDDLKYGFDWLGDEHYDFGKTDVPTERRGRYNFIFDNVHNSINDPDINSPASKVTVVME